MKSREGKDVQVLLISFVNPNSQQKRYSSHMRRRLVFKTQRRQSISLLPLRLIRVNALSLSNVRTLLDAGALSAAGVHALEGLAVLLLGHGSRLVGAGHVGCLVVLCRVGSAIEALVDIFLQMREERTYASAVGEGVCVLGHRAVVRRSVSVARHDELMRIGVVCEFWLCGSFAGEMPNMQ